MTNEELVHQIQQGIYTKDNVDTLYSNNRGFIASICGRYSYICKGGNGYNSVAVIEFKEQKHEAYFGLVDSVDKYDPNQ